MNNTLKFLMTICAMVGMFNCVGQESSKGTIPLIKKKGFQKTINGKSVELYTLRNSSGLVAQITNYGGKVVSLWSPDKDGNYEDIVLGYPDIDGYLSAKEKYFGALIGRYGNRIGKGKFTLEGKEYVLNTNNGENHLHGGDIGYDAVVWNAVQPDGQTLVLTYVSAHMEEGYPGNLEIKVRYRLTDNNELKIEYWATTDQTTVVNLTHHSFFNLKGAGKGEITDHLLQINSNYYTPVDKGLIPTGIIASVEHSPMDFKKLTLIGKRIEDDFEQLKFGLGYDHNWVLNGNKPLNWAAKVVEPVSGRVMEVYTNEPGLQFYSGNFLDGTIIGKANRAYKYRSAFCLETQHFPDSPNNPHFPSTILNPGEEYYSVCIYKFSVTE
ncbi:galactose mutarotase [Maribacter sp. MMG018]|uniref:aldose epimerase family protein n=1 Tax=Maribacter sp. MMG018 TaxID=2822688 RepID=UPI001B3751D8|nr:aldose epimerase family protein [Maribacter sp. MMG018]MBQ4913801.1 galactose mutarotase [Maribacter sp. MMG018]